MSLCRLIVRNLKTGEVSGPEKDCVDIKSALTLKQTFDVIYDLEIWEHVIMRGDEQIEPRIESKKK